MRPRGTLPLALLAVLLTPVAAACSVAQGAHMEGRYVLWDPADGEQVPGPAMRLGVGASCETVFPSLVFDGERLLWVWDETLRLGDRRGGVVDLRALQGDLLGQNGSQLIVMTTRDATRSVSALDLDQGTLRTLRWPMEEEGPFSADRSRIAWIRHEQGQPARLLVHDLLGDARVLELPVGPEEGTFARTASVLALGERWAAGFGGQGGDTAQLWVLELATQRFFSWGAANGSHHPSGIDVEVGRGSSLSPDFLAVDGDDLYLVVGNETVSATLWRTRLPNGTFERVAALPGAGPNERPLEVARGVVVLSTGQLVKDLPGLPALLLGAAVLGAALLGRRPRRR